MKRRLPIISAFFLLCGFISNKSFAQAEWRLVNPTYNATDPDGAGPATGTVTFTLQLHTISGSINNVSAITLGWSYQSANAMIPTGAAGPGCTSPTNQPANVVLSAAFTSASFQYNTVNECFANTQTTGGQTFDRTVIGTLESSSSINLTTT